MGPKVHVQLVNLKKKVTMPITTEMAHTIALKEVAEAYRKAGIEVADWDYEPLDHKLG